ncbi:Zwei Ig domain protein zig-6 [Caenorhabditis elegans]|uniref:Zwei Ig domain protein zig-6 n=1 Tax=Caenorhabditis elegans TaxID=6239 RepID=ZIG6_CAEEL|nr:Zwei Ig domain protein zig-6 [Caenorhabditis elegans]Q22125.2 RecName: Full=Zwei Ig domain protein zig-6; AltName: Full=2 Ig domain protein zig-6; Flags: Precursor [Caenorhabditis elegans]CCD68815.1 Zwei Ig domain protein zig-6 [Caenorhabditis elegans]|eukprot:NP_508882.3 Zwei Ig domain protein zig-6 [Caenorhabditis elegans]
MTKLCLLLLPLVFLVSYSFAEEEITISISPNANPVQKPIGHQISLVCSIKKTDSNGEKPGMIWKKHGGLDRTGNVEVKKLDDYTLGLIIRNSSVEDSGVYYCQAQVGSKVYMNKMDVIVFEDIVFRDKQLHFGQVLATASVNISCEVSAKKDSVITYWTRHGKQILEGGKHKFYSRGSILEIQNYQPEQDAGQYTCEVFHVSSGSSNTKTVTLGTTGEKNYVACQQMCNSFCTDVHNKVFTNN